MFPGGCDRARYQFPKSSLIDLSILSFLILILSIMDSIQIAIAELQAEVQRQRNEIQFLRNQPPDQKPKTKPKPSLPDPEKFSGQSYKFDTWLPSIKAKLRIDSESIGDPVAQFYYVYLNLDSQVQAMVLPQLSQAEESQSWNYMTILDQLSRVYDNPNKVQEAEDKLLSLKQGNESLHAYIAKFERILYEARGQNWPDVNKISTFRNGLSSTIRGRLSQQLNLPRSYPDFIRVVQQLAGRSLSSFPQASTPGNGSGNYHSEPMDLNAITTQQQRELRELEKCCIRCKSVDHWVRDCPQKPHISDKLVVATLDDEDYDDGSVSDVSGLSDHLDWKKRV